ncbi:tellurite resistance TerB family protein [Bartonella sp. LJL80]
MLDAKKIFTDLLQSRDSATQNSQNATEQNNAANFSVGDLLGGLFGGNQKGNMLEGLIKGGGLAAIAGVAFEALKNFQKDDDAANQKVDLTDIGQSGAEHNSDFALTLVRAMIQAAKADGHVDAKERKLIQAKIAESDIDEKTTQFLMAELEKPVDLDSLVKTVNTDEQKTELYVASRMALDPNKPKDRNYLDNLTQKLSLPEGLLKQVEQAIAQVGR